MKMLCKSCTQGEFIVLVSYAQRDIDSVKVILVWDMSPKQNTNTCGAMTLFSLLSTI